MKKGNSCCATGAQITVLDRKPTLLSRICAKSSMAKVRLRRIADRREFHAEYKDSRKERPSVMPLTDVAAKASVHAPSAQALVKQHLESGKSITVIDCLRMFHTTELRTIIARLGKTMTIHDEYVTTTDGKRYKRYFC